jgi:hypothetical protein
VKGIRVLGIFYFLLLTRSFEGYSSSWDKEKFEIGFGNSGKEADAMPSDFRRLDF